MEIIRLNDTTSTNDYLLNMQTSNEVCAVATFQSAGKGMAGNTWESEPGKNLLFSILIHPEWLPVAQQFLMSMATALALHDALAPLVPAPDALTVKWPNDIYYGDRKMSGTRIDVNLQGWMIQDMVIGTGININQTVFLSDAPNPVSLKQITGKEHNPEDILACYLERHNLYAGMLAQGNATRITELYHKRLYRRDGIYTYEDKDGLFDAVIEEVAPNGIITLRRIDGTISKYEFKEVKAIL